MVASSKELPPSTSPFFPNEFFKNQFCAKPQIPPKDTDLSGRLAIVTGSNTGLGLECAKQLLSYKLARLIMAVRSLEKGESAAAQLRKQHPGAVVSVWQLDMASYDSIRAFVARAGAELSRIDVAILNAGLGFGAFKLVPGTGHEETVQVNYLSTMLLSILLLPVLKAKAPAAGRPGRLTICTAMLSITAKFPNRDEVPLLPSFDEERYYDPLDVYCTSKLLGQLFAWKLTDRVSADDVVINLVEPGFIKGTDLHRDRSVASKVAMGVFSAVTARSVKLGVSTYIDATVVKGKESHGCILANWEIAPYAPFQYTPRGKEIMERLWEETLAEFSFIDVNGILKSL